MKRYLPQLLVLVLIVVSGAVWGGEGRAQRVRELRADLARAEQLARQDAPRAEVVFRAALDEAEHHGSTLLLARALDGLAAASRAAGRLDEAASLYTRVIPLWEELLGSQQPRLAVSLHNLGAVHLKRREPGRAAPLFRRALSIWTLALGPDSPQAANSRRALELAVRAGADPR